MVKTMSVLRSMSIRNKLTAIMLLTSTVALLLACLAFVSYELIVFRGSMVNMLLSTAEMVGYNSTAALSFRDPASADATLKSLTAHPHIVGGAVYDTDGKLFATYRRAVLKGTFNPPAVAADGHRFTSHRLQLFRGVTLAGERVGTVYIESDLDEMHARLWRYAFIVGLVMVVASNAAYVLSRRLQTVISGPISHLAEVVGVVARERDYSVRAVKQDEDELGQLIDGFNDMLNQVQTRDSALREARDTLEKRVLERTTELRSSKAFLDRVINAIGDPVFVKDEQRRFVLVNDALCNIVGRPREGLLGQDGDDMFPPEQGDIFRTVDAAVLDTGEENLNEESLANLANGEVHLLVTRKSRYLDPSGRRFLVGSLHDITKRKAEEEFRLQTEATLQRQQRLASVGTLARGMAHEINNPIMGVMNYAQLIKDTAADNASLVEFADEIIAEIRRVATMTHSLLSFALQQDAQPFAPTTGADAVGSVLPLAEKAARERGIVLSSDIPPDLPSVSCSPGQLGQVVMALLTNAMEVWGEGTLDPASPEAMQGKCLGGGDKAIHLTAQRIDKAGRAWLRLTVEDNGPGIPAEIREHVFDPFFTTKDRTKHSGLGLWISRSIAQEHGGELTCESEMGHGARFHVDIPVVQGVVRSVH